MASSPKGESSNDDGVGNNQTIVRAGYKELLDNIVGNEEELAELQNPKLFDIMETNEELFEQVGAPQEAVMDARVIKQVSRLCRQQAEKMSANINPFSQQEFAEKLINNMTGGDVGSRVSRRKWILLGKQVKGMFRRSPGLTYMYGALDTTPLPPKERKAAEGRTARQAATKVKDLVATQATELQQAETSNQTEQMVTHVLKSLVSCWKEADKTPINLFKFIINPSCFGSTVENIFHASFLIKEGKAMVTIGEEGQPCIVPVGRKRQVSGEEIKSQVVMNIGMADWERLKDLLCIKEAMIEKVDQQETGEPGGKRLRLA